MNKFTITHNIFYSLDLSSIYYDDFISELGDKFNRINDGYIVIGDASKPQFTWSEIRAMNKVCLLDLVSDILGWGYDSLTKKELESEARNITKLDYLKDLCDNSGWRDIQEYTFIAHGHSQGDAVKVFILDSEYNYITCEYIENLFYNCPLTGTIEIIDIETDNTIQEIYIDEYLDNQYGFYDKKDIVKLVSEIDFEHKEIVLSYLEYNLENNFDYK